jgi:hypothetical protein
LGTRRGRAPLRGERNLADKIIATIVGALAFCPTLAAAKELRSLEVKHEFRRLHPYPLNWQPDRRCPGYIKDCVVPLACGGPDSVANLQWQTVSSAKAKDRCERKGCYALRSRL